MLAKPTGWSPVRKKKYKVLAKRRTKRMGFEFPEILIEVEGKERWIETRRFTLIKEEND